MASCADVSVEMTEPAAAPAASNEQPQEGEAAVAPHDSFIDVDEAVVKADAGRADGADSSPQQETTTTRSSSSSSSSDANKKVHFSELGLTCASGHPLRPTAAVDAEKEFICNACDLPQRGDVMLGCRKCDFDTCVECAATANDMDVVTLRAEVGAAADAAAAENEVEAFDFCTRQALCPMTCVDEKCRLHLTSTLLLILSFFLFADQQLVAPNLSQIGDDFNMTDNERDLYLGGILPLCFFTVGTPISIFMGPIIDRVHRRNLFVILIFMGEIPCMCTWWVTEVWQLLLTRAITGMSMAGAEPLIFSMLSDMYGVKERNIMSSVITIGQGAGLLAGQALAGFLGPSYGWRLPFLCVSCPSMAFSLLMLLLVEEPVRGAGEESVRNASEEAKELDSDAAEVVYTSNFTCSKLGQIFCVRTNMLLYWSEIPSAMGWGVLFAFLTDFVAIDKRFTVENATTAVAILGVGLALGAVAGGILGQHLNNTCVSFRGSVAVLVGVAALLGPLAYYWVIYADFECVYDNDTCLEEAGYNTSLQYEQPIDEGVNDTLNECYDKVSYTECPGKTWGILVTLLFLSGLCLGVPTANSRAMLLNTNLPETRGTAVGILVILSNVGKGTGPLVAAAMILSLGRSLAFTIITVVFSFAAVTYFITACTYASDIEAQVLKVEEQVRIRGLTDQSFEMKDLAERLAQRLARREAGEDVTDSEDDGGDGGDVAVAVAVATTAADGGGDGDGLAAAEGGGGGEGSGPAGPAGPGAGTFRVSDSATLDESKEGPPRDNGSASGDSPAAAGERTGGDTGKGEGGDAAPVAPAAPVQLEETAPDAS